MEGQTKTEDDVDDLLENTKIGLFSAAHGTITAKRLVSFFDGKALTEGETIAVRKAYYSEDALVLDVDYHNPDTDVTRELLYMDVTAEAGDVPLAQSVQVVHDISVSAGKTMQLTVVIQGEDLLNTGVDLSDLQWEIRAAYREQK